MTSKFSRNFTCRKCENIVEAMEYEEKLCDAVETLQEFSYLGGRVCIGGGCEAAVTQEQDVGGLSFGNVVSCCVAGDFL